MADSAKRGRAKVAESESSRQPVQVSLHPHFFTEKKRLFIESGALKAELFLYDSGVAAVQLENGVSELNMLPFQGQQIWSATFGGRNVTMKSMFSQPQPTTDYVQTYGGFLSIAVSRLWACQRMRMTTHFMESCQMLVSNRRG